MVTYIGYNKSLLEFIRIKDFQLASFIHIGETGIAVEDSQIMYNLLDNGKPDSPALHTYRVCISLYLNGSMTEGLTLLG